MSHLLEVKNLDVKFNTDEGQITAVENVSLSVDQGEVLGIVHSHPDGELAFSHTDRMACKYIDLPFYLVEPKSESIIVIYPSEIND